jgi:hypothetical protein
METIKFVPTFEISLTEDDLVSYYKANNITDYPKRVNGGPCMSRKFNKQHTQILYTQKALELQEKYAEYIKTNVAEKREQALKLKIDSYKGESCSICSDPLTSASILECGHIMCMTCAISHFRLKHDCPFCRAVVCDKPVERHVMPNQTTLALIDNTLSLVEQSRYNLTMPEYIRNRLVYFKQSHNINLDLYTESIIRELQLIMGDLSHAINTWYA